MRFVTLTLYGSVENFSCSCQCKKVTFTQHINELQMYCIIGLLKLILLLLTMAGCHDELCMPVKISMNLGRVHRCRQQREYNNNIVNNIVDNY